MAGDPNLTSIEKLLRTSEPDRHPLFNFKWICTSLPFGMDESYVESVDLPWINIAAGTPWHAGASSTSYPEWSNTGTFSLNLYEDSSCRTMKWLVFWKNQIKTVYGDANTVFGIYNTPKYYKRDLQFALLATDNSIVMTVNLIGCWPLDTSSLSLDYTSSERVKYSQTFSCDDQSIIFATSSAPVDKSSFINIENQVFAAIPNSVSSNINAAINVASSANSFANNFF